MSEFRVHASLIPYPSDSQWTFGIAQGLSDRGGGQGAAEEVPFFFLNIILHILLRFSNSSFPVFL